MLPKGLNKKLECLDVLAPADKNELENDNVFRRLVLTLEEKYIRYYPKVDRIIFEKAINNSSWQEELFKYCQGLKINVSIEEIGENTLPFKLALIDRLASFAIQEIYLDKFEQVPTENDKTKPAKNMTVNQMSSPVVPSPKAKSSPLPGGSRVAPPGSTPVNNKKPKVKSPPQPKKNEEVATPEVKTEETKSEKYSKKIETDSGEVFDLQEAVPYINELLELLKIPKLHTNQVSDRDIEDALNCIIIRMKPPEKCNMETSPNHFSVGYKSESAAMNEAVRVIRLLNLQRLRTVQNHVNDVISQLQLITANPKTDTKLGRVGT